MNLSFRSLLNAAYAYLAAGRDEEGLRELDGELEALPRPGSRGGAARPRSRGTAQLMAVFGGK